MIKKILIPIFIVVLASCSKTDQKQITITEFDEIFVDSLIPIEDNAFGYSTYNIILKGQTNDSIEIRTSLNRNDKSYSLFFTGTIDTRLNFDYYGGLNQYLYFNPYKATEGKLEIRYSLD